MSEQRKPACEKGRTIFGRCLIRKRKLYRTSTVRHSVSLPGKPLLYTTRTIKPNEKK
jgi:hypothetical protein